MTLAILNTSAVLTMTTREIAVLLEKQHSHIKISAERLAEKGVIALRETPYTDPQNKQTYTEYLLNKRDSLILVAQNCPEFTARIVDRWQELEEKQAKPAFAIPQTLSQALRLAADQSEQIETQKAQLAIAAPKVAFVEKYVESTGNKGFREVCKLLQANESQFREFLLGANIMYRLGGALMPKAQHMDAGRFVVKTGTSDDGHAFNSAKFTPKGVEWVAGLWAVNQLRKAA